jgi:hypothetical protein
VGFPRKITITRRFSQIKNLTSGHFPTCASLHGLATPETVICYSMHILICFDRFAQGDEYLFRNPCYKFFEECNIHHKDLSLQEGEK